MGKFLDEPIESKQPQMATDWLSETPVKEKPYFGSFGEDASNVLGKISGVVGASGKLGKKSDIKDLPYIGAKFLSGMAGSIPEQITRRPMAFATGGVPGLALSPYEKAEEKQLPFPQPFTKTGRNVGIGAEFVGGMINPSLAIKPTAIQMAKAGLGKPAKKGAISMMQRILRPKGELANKGAEIAETALKEGIVGTKAGMLKKTYKMLQEGGEEVGEILKKYQNKDVDPQIIFKDMKELIQRKKFAQNKKAVKALTETLNDWKEEFKEMKKVRFKKDVGGTWDMDVVPAEYFPNTKTVTRNQKVNRPVTVQEAQARKVAQYQELAEGGKFPQEAKSSEILGRKAYARGLKKSIEQQVPEIAPLNKRFGDLSDVSRALEQEVPVSGRKQLFGLGDVIFGAQGAVNPAALAVGGTRKVMQMTPVSSRMARGMYRFGTNPVKPGDYALTYPLARALMNQMQEN